MKNGTFLKGELSTYKKKTKEVLPVSSELLKQVQKSVPSAFEKKFTFYYGKNAEGKMQKACTIVSQMGKEGPMSLGLCFKESGEISALKVLQFSEDHGKGVKSDSFLGQFLNRKLNEELKVGKNIDGLSGATQSSNAITDAVTKAQLAFKGLVIEGGKL